MIQILSEEDEGEQIRFEGIIDNKSERSDSELDGGLPTCMNFIKQRKILVNLVIMSVIWAINSFNYYMIQFIFNKF